MIRCALISKDGMCWVAL